MSSLSGMPNPLSPIETRDQALRRARLSAVAFGLWAVNGLLQAGLVWSMANAEYEAYRGATTGFAVFFALVAGAMAWIQWRRPNRILPIFGIAWALYELSAFGVSAAVGAPLGSSGLPIWSPILAAGVMLVCLVLHAGGLRGSAALTRMDGSTAGRAR